jgi:protein NEDD1
VILNFGPKLANHVTSTRRFKRSKFGFSSLHFVTMLAISTTEALSLLDTTTLKNSPSSVSSGQPFSAPPIASVWSQDNSNLLVAFSDSIYQYSPAGTQVNEIYSRSDGITCIIAKDKGQAIIFGELNKVNVLEYGSGTGKITQTLAPHKSPVNALSLSNDSTLLASTSSSAAYVQNLSLGSHTILRGLPQSSGQITTCAFHPHSRTRLLLGMKKQILVYDTTRPSGPVKAIPISDATSGDIVAVACSPFSKTLVAVATSGGNVGLVDLDKEKRYVCHIYIYRKYFLTPFRSLFRTLNLKMPLTSASFSPEGAALYFGTENGKLLIVDLRALDKPPKCISIGEGGCRIECMSFQVHFTIVLVFIEFYDRRY